LPKKPFFCKENAKAPYVSQNRVNTRSAQVYGQLHINKGVHVFRQFLSKHVDAHKGLYKGGGSAVTFNRGGNFSESRSNSPRIL